MLREIKNMTGLRDTSIMTTGLITQVWLNNFNTLISLGVGVITLFYAVVKLSDYLAERKHRGD